MAKTILFRGARAVCLFLMLHLFLFALFSLLPNGLGAIFGWGALDPSFRAEMEKDLGLNQGWHGRYLNHLRSVATFDLGLTLRGQYPVQAVLGKGILTSFPLFLAIAIGGLVGPLVALKVFVPKRRSTNNLHLQGAINLPPFFIAAMFYALYQTIGREWWSGGARFFLWPCAFLASSLFPFVVAYAVSSRSVTSMTNSGFFTNLRAIGLTTKEQRRVMRPMVYYAVLPSVARVAMTGMLSTAFVEWLFGIPGFGYLGLRALQDADFGLMFGWTLIAAVIVTSLSEMELWCKGSV